MQNRHTMTAQDLFFPEKVQVFDRMTGEYLGTMTLKESSELNPAAGCSRNRQEVPESEKESINKNQLSLF